MDCDQPQISFSSERGRCILRLAGALGVAEAGQLRRTALEWEAYSGDVAVDCGAVTQLDASIIQVLLALRERNRSLVSASMAPAVRDWLDTAGLSPVLGAPGEPE